MRTQPRLALQLRDYGVSQGRLEASTMGALACVPGRRPGPNGIDVPPSAPRQTAFGSQASFLFGTERFLVPSFELAR